MLTALVARRLIIMMVALRYGEIDSRINGYQ